MNLSKYSLITCCFLFNTMASSANTETAADRRLTSVSTLKNGIPLIIRETPGSDIVHIELSYTTGTSSLSPDRRALNLLAFETMPYATKKYSKEKVFALTEKYSFGVECKGGVEVSHCQVETVKDFLPQALDLLLSVVTEPIFNAEDVDLSKKQRVADFQQEAQNPETQVNAVVNTVFYDASHPYRLLPEDGIKQTLPLTVEDLRGYHRTTLDASTMYLIYAGPKIDKTTITKLNEGLGKIGKTNRTPQPIPPPAFDPKNSFAFEHRAIPTAYIRMKFNAPSATSPDAAAAEVMFQILSEKLHEEVRTKRSLSYAIHAGTIQYKEGIGMIAASTSKPRETIETIAAVVRDFRDKGVSQENLNEYRNIFTTGYYLTMETHDQLANALSSSQAYFGDATRLYDLPARLNAVTPADIQRVAKETLKNIRVGVVYDKDKFKNEWVQPIKAL
ncbi:MAG: pitrilysin family protein [Pseudomonadota bacterium]